MWNANHEEFEIDLWPELCYLTSIPPKLCGNLSVDILLAYVPQVYEYIRAAI